MGARQLEPLTANKVIAVEGISDRIIVEKVADLTRRNLDRLGVSLVQTDGAGDMPAIVTLFGPTGFNIPLALLIDEDARGRTAKKLGVDPDDLEEFEGTPCFISVPDLEGEYVDSARCRGGLGSDRGLWSFLVRSDEAL